MSTQNIFGINGKVRATTNVSSSFYQKNAVGKFTDLNYVHNILSQVPQMYDKAMIELFNQTRLYSNDFLDLVMKEGQPFMVEDPTGVFQYKIKKFTELPKVVENLADAVAKPGIDGQEFELVFDKNVFVVNDIITSHRYEQDTLVQIASDGERYQNFFKYRCRAIGGDKSTAFVHQKFLKPGTEYFKVGNALGEFTSELSSLGIIDGSLTVTNDVIQQFGIEHTVTDWAESRVRNIFPTKDVNGNPLDIVYYSLTGELNGQKQNFTMWEPTVVSLMRMEMMRMKANIMMWGRAGIGYDEKGRPVKAKDGLWKQMHKGNVFQFDRGTFSLNLIRKALGDLFYGRVRKEDRKARIYTNRAGMELMNTAIKKDFRAQGFTLNADKFLDGKDRMKQGYAFDFDHFMTVETGPVEVVELEQLNESITYQELGPNKKTPAIFMILDVSGSDNAGIRVCKFKSRPDMMYKVIPGTTGADKGTLAVSKDPWTTYIMKDWTGLFLEDPTRTVLLKEYPQV